MSKRATHIIALVFILTACVASSKTIYVDVNATGANDGTSWTDAFTVIQDAIDDAEPNGDLIIVAPGTYSDGGVHYVTCNLGTKNIHIKSVNPLDLTTRQTTIMEGNSIYEGIVMAGNQDERTIIEGFTIQNCKGYSSGGAIAGMRYYDPGLYNKSSIRHNIIKQNQAAAYNGGAIAEVHGHIYNNVIEKNYSPQFAGAIYNCDGVIESNLIKDNSTGGQWGGGLVDCDGLIRNNRIIHNYSPTGGGGFYDCDGVIDNNIIEGNYGNRGGGIYACDGFISGNTIYGNYATQYGGGLGRCYGIISNCIIWANSAGTSHPQLYYCSIPIYSDIQGGYSGSEPSIMVGNIDQNPLFVAPGSWAGTPGSSAWNQGDYHLGVGSPCIDSGDKLQVLDLPIRDVEGFARIENSDIDMGAHEYGSSIDTDGDLLSDTDEAGHGSQVNNMDTDGDGLADGLEVIRGTLPATPDIPGTSHVTADFDSIQEAIWLAFPSETIEVAEGTYQENIHLQGKNIVLTGSNPDSASVVQNTIINGNSAGSVVTFLGNEGTTCVLRGFTITNGITEGDGGGINGYNTLATIEKNHITANTCEGVGAGIAYCQGTIRMNLISGNSAYYEGGGLAYCDGLISNNTISDNTTESEGGGLACCNGTIDSNLITSNSCLYYGGGGLAECEGYITSNTITLNFTVDSSYGGGGLYYCQAELIANNIISFNDATGTYGGGASECYPLINNIISGNTAYEGGGLSYCSYVHNNVIVGNYASEYEGGIYSCSNFRNNIVWDNYSPTDPQMSSSEDPTYCCIQDWTGGGTGNISSNPLFMSPGSWSGSPGTSEWTDGNYHLQTLSPCIDSGGDPTFWSFTLDFDYENDPRPYDAVSWESRGDGTDYDMGVDEFIGTVPTPVWTPTPTPTPTPTAGPTPTPFAHFTFESGTDGWTAPASVPPYDVALTSSSGGHLGLCPNGSTNCFSFWLSPDVTIVDGLLYRARWQVGSTSTNPDSDVQFRLRINQKGSWQAWNRIVSSNKQQAPAAGSPEWYTMIFDPVVTGSGDNLLVLNFDIMSFDGTDDTSSWLYLEEVILDTTSYVVDILVDEYTFDSDSEGWSFIPNIPPFANAISSVSEGQLGLNPNGSTNAFSYWLSPDLTIQDNKIYRAQFEMGSNVTNPDTAVQCRLRINQKGSWQAWDRIINSNLGQSPSASSPKTYNVILAPDVTGTDDNLLVFNFDIMSFDLTDDTSSWLYLKTARLEEITPSP